MVVKPVGEMVMTEVELLVHQTADLMVIRRDYGLVESTVDLMA